MHNLVFLLNWIIACYFFIPSYVLVLLITMHLPYNVKLQLVIKGEFSRWLVIKNEHFMFSDKVIFLCKMSFYTTLKVFHIFVNGFFSVLHNFPDRGMTSKFHCYKHCSYSYVIMDRQFATAKHLFQNSSFSRLKVIWG